ncbi:hypothetical protein Pme01_36760 [Planosporangium mesophilum]|uniref:N-acetyltransferase domain-containing protein n=1 Tax=Planosporangium mesophilum TaxID=689768 RepID=A0A8J3X276_9ACTN|nr:hypothetical protein Pme01_36760 [Planosporangium mesophilum]
MRGVTDRVELEDVSALFRRVWGAAHPVVPFSLLRALSHAGGMVLGAYHDGRLVGAAVGFLGGDPARPYVHSHIVGVDAGWQGRGVGTGLKLEQRRWCLDRGIDRITWTFDPLIRRNAVFNLARLGAAGVDYLPDFYGPMDDRYNAGMLTDRVLVEWDLTAAPSPAGQRPHRCLLDADERRWPRLDPAHHAPPDGTDVWVRVPADVHQERGLAREWRDALRSVMEPALAAGYRWTGVTDAGWYVLTKEPS